MAVAEVGSKVEVEDDMVAEVVGCREAEVGSKVEEVGNKVVAVVKDRGKCRSMSRRIGPWRHSQSRTDRRSTANSSHRPLGTSSSSRCLRIRSSTAPMPRLRERPQQRAARHA